MEAQKLPFLVFFYFSNFKIIMNSKEAAKTVESSHPATFNGDIFSHHRTVSKPWSDIQLTGHLTANLQLSSFLMGV